MLSIPLLYTLLQWSLLDKFYYAHKSIHSQKFHPILFYHLKKLLCQLYNTILQYTHHPNFYFPILLIKIIFIHNKIIYSTITIIYYTNTLFILSLFFFLFKNHNYHHHCTTHTWHHHHHHQLITYRQHQKKKKKKKNQTINNPCWSLKWSDLPLPSNPNKSPIITTTTPHAHQKNPLNHKPTNPLN